MTIKKNASVIELILSGKDNQVAAGPLLEGVLIQAGVPLSNLVEEREGDRVRVSLYFNSLSQARRVTDHLRSVQLKAVTAKLRLVRPQDWQNRWKEDFRPFKITDKLDIVPMWCTDKYRPSKRTPIYIDTVMAFGTGYHETTRFMAQLISSVKGKFGNFLDVGTGTGILSLIAHKCGADEVFAIDNDRECIKVARKNFAVNHYPATNLKAADVKTYKPKGQFDFVAANLMTQDLIRLKRKLCSLVAPGKFLAVSGISKENFSWLKKEYEALPLKRLKTLEGKKWVAVLYKRT